MWPDGTIGYKPSEVVALAQKELGAGEQGGAAAAAPIGAPTNPQPGATYGVPPGVVPGPQPGMPTGSWPGAPGAAETGAVSGVPTGAPAGVTRGPQPGVTTGVQPGMTAGMVPGLYNGPLPGMEPIVDLGAAGASHPITTTFTRYQSIRQAVIDGAEDPDLVRAYVGADEVGYGYARMLLGDMGVPEDRVAGLLKEARTVGEAPDGSTLYDAQDLVQRAHKDVAEYGRAPNVPDIEEAGATVGASAPTAAPEPEPAAPDWANTTEEERQAALDAILNGTADPDTVRRYAGADLVNEGRARAIMSDMGLPNSRADAVIEKLPGAGERKVGRATLRLYDPVEVVKAADAELDALDKEVLAPRLKAMTEEEAKAAAATSALPQAGKEPIDRILAGGTDPKDIIAWAGGEKVSPLRANYMMQTLGLSQAERQEVLRQCQVVGRGTANLKLYDPVEVFTRTREVLDKGATGEGGSALSRLASQLGDETGSTTIATALFADWYNVLTKARDDLLDKLAGRKPLPQPLSPEAQAALQERLPELLQSLNYSRTYATRMGIAARHWALHNYSDKRAADVLAAIMFQFPYWSSRSYPKWAIRVLENPALLASYMRVDRAVQEANKDLPEYYRHRIRIANTGALSFLAEPVVLDYQRIISPVQQLFENFDRPGYDKTFLGRVYNAANSLGFGPQALIAYALAVNMARQGDTRAALQNVGYAAPLTKFIRYGTAAAGVNQGRGVTIEPWNMWKKWDWRAPLSGLGIGGDVYTRKYTAAAIDELLRTHKISETQAREASYNLAHGNTDDPVVTQAMQLVTKKRWPSVAASFLLGLTTTPYSENEAELAKRNEERTRIYATYTGEELQQQLAAYYNKYPEMRYQDIANADDLLKADREYTWQILDAIPPGRSNLVMQELDPSGQAQRLLNKFYNSKGNLASFSVDERTKFMGFVAILADKFAVPTDQMAQGWQRAITAYHRIKDEAGRRFPGAEQQEQAYFAAREQGVANPPVSATLQAYWDYRDQQLRQDPNTFYWYGKTPRSQAINILWNIYRDDHTNTRAVEALLGPDFKKLFVNKDTRNYDAIPSDRLYNWVVQLTAAGAAGALGKDTTILRSAKAELGPFAQVEGKGGPVTEPAQMGMPEEVSGGQPVAPPVPPTSGPAPYIAGAPTGAPAAPAAAPAASPASGNAAPPVQPVGLGAPRPNLKQPYGTDVPPDIDVLIATEAQKQNVDPNLVRAIIKVESGFNPDATSSANAVGLMQVMPSDLTKDQYGDMFSGRPTAEQLKDPATNLASGVSILKGALDAAGGDLAKALTSYSGGYSEEQYAKPVLQWYDYYTRLYGPPAATSTGVPYGGAAGVHGEAPTPMPGAPAPQYNASEMLFYPDDMAAAHAEYKKLTADLYSGDAQRAAQAKAALADHKYDPFRGPGSLAWETYYNITPGWRAVDAGLYEDPTVAAWLDPKTRDQVPEQQVIARLLWFKQNNPNLSFGDPNEYDQARQEEQQWQKERPLPRTSTYRKVQLSYALAHPVWAKYYLRPEQLANLQAQAAAGWPESHYGGGRGGGGGWSGRGEAPARFRPSNEHYGPHAGAYPTRLAQPKVTHSDLWYQVTQRKPSDSEIWYMAMHPRRSS